MSDPTPDDKLRVLQEQHSVAGTALDKLARLTDRKPGGRFANPSASLVDRAEKLASFSPHHPRAGHSPDGPYGCNWPNPLESPLGFSVDAMQPVGTPAEIAASIQALQPPSASPSVVGAEASLSSANSERAPSSGPDVVAARSVSSSRIRRL
jgi:hypothetical protein